MKILINEFEEKVLKEQGLFYENKYIVNRYIENIEDYEFVEVENEQERWKMNRKANPYNSRTNQHKCYKEDKKNLDKLFKLVRKAYYSDVDKFTINFTEVKEEIEELKKGYCDEL